MNVARAWEPASAHVSLQAMSLSYFKNSDFYRLIADKYNVVTCESVAYRSYFTNKSLCAARSLISVCNNVCVCL